MSARRDPAGDSEACPEAQDLALPRETARRTPARAVGLYLLFTVVSLCTRLPFLRAGLLNMDEASHLLGAWEVLRGGRLYVDFADNKPPLVYLYYAAAQALLGKGILSVRVLTATVLVPLTALCAASFFGGGRRGRAAGYAYVLASSALLASDSHATHCEHVLLLPLSICMVVLRYPVVLWGPLRLFAAGVLLGAATLAKQPAAACLAVPISFVVLHFVGRAQRAGVWGRLRPHRDRLSARRQRLKVPEAAFATLALLTALLAGFLAPLLLAAAVFSHAGTLRSAVFWIWQFNLGHIDNPMPIPDMALRATKMGGVLIPSVAPLAIAALLGRAGPSCGHRATMPLVLAVATLVPALLGWRLFGHYFLPFLFAMSLAAGPFLGARRDPLRRAAIFGLGAIASLGFALANRWVFDPAHCALAEVVHPAFEHIGEALRADRCGKGGRLFVWGYAPNVYVYAGERPASRFVVPIDTLTGYLAGNDAVEEGRVDTHRRIRAAHWSQLMGDLARTMPAHIVDTAPADLNHWGRFSMDRFPLLDAFVQRHYHVRAVVDGAVIYARNGCDAGAIAHSH